MRALVVGNHVKTATTTLQPLAARPTAPPRRRAAGRCLVSLQISLAYLFLDIYYRYAKYRMRIGHAFDIDFFYNLTL